MIVFQSNTLFQRHWNNMFILFKERSNKQNIYIQLRISLSINERHTFINIEKHKDCIVNLFLRILLSKLPTAKAENMTYGLCGRLICFCGGQTTPICAATFQRQLSGICRPKASGDWPWYSLGICRVNTGSALAQEQNLH